MMCCSPNKKDASPIGQQLLIAVVGLLAFANCFIGGVAAQDASDQKVGAEGEIMFNGTVDGDDGTLPPMELRELAKLKPDWPKSRKEGDTSNVLFAEDGTCGWWNGKAYEKPLMNYSNALEPEPQVDNYEDDFLFEAEMQLHNCLFRYQTKSLMPACGDNRFPLLKYCSLVGFFNNKLPKPIEEKNSDLLLMLIDGCVLCKLAQHTEAPRVNITLKHTWPKGSFFTGCSREENIADTTEFDLNRKELFDDLIVNRGIGMKSDYGREYYSFREGYSSSFFQSGILYQRNCKGLLGADKKQTEYRDLMLVVEHNCGESVQTFTIKLADIKPTEFKNNVAEVRGLMLILEEDKPEWKQFSMANQQFMDDESLMAINGGHPVYGNRKDE